MKAYINKKTLNIICEEKGVSEKFLSDKCNIDIERMKDFLDPNSSDLPAIGQAKEIAKRLHIPFAGLYMEPEHLPLKSMKKGRIVNYRSMYIVSNDDSMVNLAIWDLLDAREEINKTFELLDIEMPTFSITAPKESNITYWANAIRSLFGFDIEQQYCTTSKRQLYLYLREKIEEQGIIVQSFMGVPLEELRGISIFDETPIIGINDNDRYPGKTFSLIHELVHLIKRQSALCNEMVSSFTQTKEEIFCNAVAGEVLVPTEELNKVLSIDNEKENDTYSVLNCLADLFSVSREVVVRRLLDNGYIGQKEYDYLVKQLLNELNDDRERNRKEARKAREEGRTYGFPRQQERIAIDRNSTKYCKALCKGYYDQLFTKQDLSRSLNLKVRHIDKFIQEVGKWNN